MPVVNFCNEHGAMVGVDPHKYITIGPYNAPIPLPFIPHFVMVSFSSYPRTKAHPEVTMAGVASFEQGADMYLIFHAPLTVAPPHAAELVNLGLKIAGSGSKLFMGVHGVTIRGGWAATCVLGPAGRTMNCADPLELPAGNVLNPNSVTTKPTAGDYAGSWAAAWVDAGIGFGTGKILDKALDKQKRKELIEQVVKHVLRRTDKAQDIDKILEWIDAPGKAADRVKKQVQESVDGALGRAP